MDSSSSARPTILLFGTCDTKFSELLFLKNALSEHPRPLTVLLADVGRVPVTHPAIDIPHSTLLPNPPAGFSELPRNLVISSMSNALVPFINSKLSLSSLHGVISIGGSGGTSLATSAMRNSALPIGFPKMIVSTMAAGDMSSFVGDSDITTMYSVVDIAGMNSILSAILTNAAGAIAGMAEAYYRIYRALPSTPKKRTVAITMFGITTPAVTHARKIFEEENCEVFVFHCTGAGGRSMEKLILEGKMDGVLDLTTTELTDELVGGNMSAGEDRLTAASKMGVPQVISTGALDCVNFGPKDTVPGKFRDRDLLVHNDSVTLMCVNDKEMAMLGTRMAERIVGSLLKPWRTEIWLPMAGFSSLSSCQGPWEGKVKFGAFLESLVEGLGGFLDNEPRLELRVKDAGINEESFAELAACRLIEMMKEAEEEDSREHNFFHGNGRVR
ncbi:UPF0261-domain-containing protein [Choiromyces venosus 120613-1]|uniref:UPF0261-domain-containing protein n=1 Tax=Choiromyces venosus 120613-1 TaxID=1336337 RepID=A0A3N4JJY2_9PEZI|nr:UPF0261-domain-containing protein [Choiromyces venosus 120613-1]